MSAAAAEAVKPFRDCPVEQGCPEMLMIKGSDGEITIGSPEGESGRVDNEAQVSVRIGPFAIGRFEVTVAEYLACANAKACPPPEWLDPNSPHNIKTGTGFYYRNLGTSITGENQPVTGVSHSDAVAFATWLSKKTGHNYRLPSEAEWEYAARAGTTTARWWGEELKSSDGRVMAHCRGCETGFDGRGPAPANSLEPNPWGLYNVLGNVWEWVADFYCEDYTERPRDGTARAKDDCPSKDGDDLHVFRGGSTYYGPEKIRAASRLRNFANFRNFSVGFRIARSTE